jgi:hypothetical protein
MDTNGVHRPVDLAAAQRNMHKVPPEALSPYLGKHIAWNWDGTSILAWGESYEDLYAKLDALGIPLECVIHDFVDDMGYL